MLIGLTGGIASGKTLVSDRFATLGAPTVDADLLAREVVAPGTPGLADILERFGDSVVQPDGTLDRPALREIVFSDKASRAALDGMLHPRIRALSEQRIAQALQSGADYVVYAVPLLVETDQASRFDRIVVVDVPVEVQIERLVQRDGVDATRAQQIIASQATREQRLAVANDVIDNSGSPDATCAQVDALDRRYRALPGTC